MSASSSGSKPGEGVIRVVPESGEILAICTEGEFDLSNARHLDEHAIVALNRERHIYRASLRASLDKIVQDGKMDSTRLHRLRPPPDL